MLVFESQTDLAPPLPPFFFFLRPSIVFVVNDLDTDVTLLIIDLTDCGTHTTVLIQD